MATYAISEVARLCGISADTLRHYEKRGLIKPPIRTAAGYRQYGDEDIVRVQQIRRALSLGFKLRELAEIFTIRRRGGVPCRKALGILEERLLDLERKLEELATLRDTMRTTVSDWRARVEAAGSSKPAHLLEG